MERLKCAFTTVLDPSPSECRRPAHRVGRVTRPDDVVVLAYLDVLCDDGVPVEAVAEDLGHGYGNGTLLLTLRDRLASHDSFSGDVLLGGSDLATMRDLASDGVDAVIAAQLVDHADVASFDVVDTTPTTPTA